MEIHFETDLGIIISGCNQQARCTDTALFAPDASTARSLIDRPDLVGRGFIFKVHRKPTGSQNPSIYINSPEQTPGFAGADIANVAKRSVPDRGTIAGDCPWGGPTEWNGMERSEMTP